MGKDSQDSNIEKAKRLWTEGEQQADRIVGFGKMLHAAFQARGISRRELSATIGQNYGVLYRQFEQGWFDDRCRAPVLIAFEGLQGSITSGDWFDREKYDALRAQWVKCMHGQINKPSKKQQRHIRVVLSAALKHYAV